MTETGVVGPGRAETETGVVGPGRAETETVRVGVDVASVASVAASIDRYGDRYLRRLFTDGEVADAAGVPAVRASRLAARFAVKEAVLKALRPGPDVPAWTDIEVRREPGGWCSLRLHGEALRAAGAAGLGPWSVSMSHEAGVAVAVVVASATPPRTERAAAG